MKNPTEKSENESYSTADHDDMYTLITTEYASSLLKVAKDKQVRDLRDMFFMEIAVFGSADEATYLALRDRITEIVRTTRKAT